MKKILFCILALTISVSAFASCTQTQTNNPSQTETDDVSSTVDAETTIIEPTVPFTLEKMPITDGSTSTYPLDVAIHAQVLGISKEEAEGMVKHTKTYESLIHLVNGECELIFRTPMSETEIEMLSEKEFAYTELPIAGEGFVFVVNRDNPVDTLTVEQIKKIYSGEITNWKEVGGEDLAIIPYQRNADSGSQNYMISFMGDVPLMEPITETLPGSMSSILDAVANYDNARGAIGYSVYAYSDGMYEDTVKIKYIKVNGVEPSLANMADGSYPLLGYNYAVFSSALPADDPIRALVDWIRSDEGQQVVADAGYVPYRKVDGLTLPEPKKLYAAKGTGTVVQSDADWYYTAYISSRRNELPTLADARINAILQDYISTQWERLNAISDEEIKQFLENRTPYTIYGKRAIDYRIKNGYLSILSAVVYDLGHQDAVPYYYKAEGAVFDLYTGDMLSFTDLFPNGADFLPALNEYLSTEATKPYSGFGIRHEAVTDFTALIDGTFTYTAESIIFTPGSLFVDGVELSFGTLDFPTVLDQPRDMEGIFADADKVIYRTFSVHGSSYLGGAEEYSCGTNGLTLSYWSLDRERGILPPEVCEKINAFIDAQYNAYFTPEQLQETLRAALPNFDTYELGPFPCFDYYLVGNRYICFNGSNMLVGGSTDGGTVTLQAHPDGGEWWLTYYFSPETGALLTVDALFDGAWMETSTVRPNTEEEASKTAADTFFAEHDVKDARITDIADFETTPNATGTQRDHDIPVSVTFVLDGVAYLLEVPREYIP